MPRVELMPEVMDDFERFVDHLVGYGVDDPPARIAQIVEALRLLERHPGIGRPRPRGLRELVIGEGARGYVALYRHVKPLDIVFVLAVRHQSERGFVQGA
jgi:plasmid stabilization system protein ParE